MKKTVIFSLLALVFVLALCSLQCLSTHNASFFFGIQGVNLVAPIKKMEEQTFLALKESNVNSVSLIPYAFVAIEKA